MKLLFIDDEPTIVHGLCWLLDYTGMGFDVVLSASQTEEAQRIIGEERPDVIVSDIVMPGMTGLQLIRQVRKMELRTKVIFLSGYQKFSYAQEAVSLGALAFLLKPVEKAQLERVLRDAVQQLKVEEDGDRISSRIRRLSNASQASPPVAQPIQAGSCCIAVAKVKPQHDRVGLQAGLLQFAAFSRVQALAEKNRITTFVKENYLVMILQLQPVDQMTSVMDTFIRTVTDNITGQLPVDLYIVRSGILPSSQDIPDAYARLVAALDAKDIQVEAQISPVDEAKEYIRAHFSEPLTLDTVASVVCMSSGYFSTLFRKEAGVGFKTFLTTVRMEAAQKMLLQSKKKIYEIAEAVGISDTKYFSETFQKQVGVTPQAFRSKERKE